MYINLELVWKEAFQVQSVFMHSVLCYHGLPTSVLSVLPVCVVLYCCTKLMPLSKQMTRYFVFTFRKKTTTYYNHSFCCCFVFNKYYYSLAEPSNLSQTCWAKLLPVLVLLLVLLPSFSYLHVIYNTAPEITAAAHSNSITTVLPL